MNCNFSFQRVFPKELSVRVSWLSLCSVMSDPEQFCADEATNVCCEKFPVNAVRISDLCFFPLTPRAFKFKDEGWGIAENCRKPPPQRQRGKTPAMCKPRNSKYLPTDPSALGWMPCASKIILGRGMLDALQNNEVWYEVRYKLRRTSRRHFLKHSLSHK